MRILKFGGSSVASSESISAVLNIILDKARGHQPLAVAVSAFQGVTNTLLSLAQRAVQRNDLPDTSKQTLDNLISKHYATFHSIAQHQLEGSDAQVFEGYRAAALEQINTWFDELKALLQGIELLKECSFRTEDQVASFGECFSALTLTVALQARGVKAQFVHAKNLIRTEGEHGRSRVNFAVTKDLIRATIVDASVIHVVTGFIGANADGYIQTLGRGGSDYTAAILAAALHASILEIWTDVDGVLTCDPRKVKKAFTLQHLSYQEALELCHFGAKVIYPPTLQPAMAQKIPIQILNTFRPESLGTYISETSTGSEQSVTGISSINDIALIQVQGSGMIGVAGVAMRLFRSLAMNQINVILITQASSEHSICVAIKKEEQRKAELALNMEFAEEIRNGQLDPIQIEEKLAIVTVVGEKMRHRVGISGQIFGSLGHNGINIRAIAQGSSERSISVVIEAQDEIKALNALHDEFFTQVEKRAHLFIIGTGLIGATLLRQVAAHQKMIKDQHSLEILVMGIANSSTSYFFAEGIPTEDLLNPKELLKKHGVQSTLENVLDSIQRMKLPNGIVVDCTASEKVTRLYPKFIEAHLPLVTPNKKAQSGAFSDYSALKNLARFNDVQFLYETSVGAGLPVISTLNDLLKSGDKIIKIEAVLSGTLSYLFNSWDGSLPFSEVVRQAQTLGYTEPDPREDLNGVDVGRKILILARECGAALEITDVEIESLVPESCRAASTVEQFFTELAQHDNAMEVQRQKAAKEQKKLCYIATFHTCNTHQLKGTAQTSLLAIDSHHPFYNLSGSDNIISFTSKRYYDRPLVVKGPGAGAEVTAAGIIADIVRISKPISG
jgi:bifunctional aspartokinase / homoserine dehydrogenase 1